METNLSNIVIIYSSYTAAQKRAIQKYREKPDIKQKINEKQKQYYLSKKEEDPDYMEKMRIKSRERYNKKKALKKLQSLEEGENIVLEIL